MRNVTPGHVGQQPFGISKATGPAPDLPNGYIFLHDTNVTVNGGEVPGGTVSHWADITNTVNLQVTNPATTKWYADRIDMYNPQSSYGSITGLDADISFLEGKTVVWASKEGIVATYIPSGLTFFSSLCAAGARNRNLLFGPSICDYLRSVVGFYIGDIIRYAELDAVERYFESRGAVRQFDVSFSDLEYGFYASDLSSFKPLDTSSVTNMYQAWSGCTSLTSFPLLDTSSVTNMAGAWSRCSSLTSFPLLETSSVTNMAGAWSGCTSLTSFPLLETSNVTNMSGAWFSCTSLTSFPLLDTSSVSNMYQAWSNCNSLTSFPLLDTSSSTYMAGAWAGCNALTDFPPNMFDSIPESWGSLFYLKGAFAGCPLSPQSLENILVSVAHGAQNSINGPRENGVITFEASIEMTLAAEEAAADLILLGWSLDFSYELSESSYYGSSAAAI